MILDYKKFTIKEDTNIEQSDIILLENWETGEVEAGDYVIVINKEQKKMPDDVYQYLLSKDMFLVKEVKKNKKEHTVIDIGCISKNTGEIYYFLFQRFKLVEPPIEKKEGYTNIQMSEKLIEKLKTLKNNPVAKFIVRLRLGVSNDLLRFDKNGKGDFLNYLDIDKTTKGAISSIQDKQVGDRVPVEEAWTSNRRQSTTFAKTLRRIFTDAYMQELDKEWTKKAEGKGNVPLIETFISDWNYIFDDEITIVVFRGKDILHPFNYYKEMDLRNQDQACATFYNTAYGYPLDVKWYDIYIKNPENVGIATMMRHGKMEGRSALFTGIALFDSGEFKKGNEYNFFNSPYCNRDPAYKAALRKWGEENKYYSYDNVHGSNLYIPFKTRVVDQYPAIDSMSVSIKYDILCTGNPKQVECGETYGTYTGIYKCNALAQAKQYGVEMNYDENNYDYLCQKFIDKAKKAKK